jgi:hypothetical protein
MGALATIGVWLLFLAISRSLPLTIAGTVVLALVFIMCMSAQTRLEYRIQELSERTSDYTDRFLDEFLAPSPELHRLFRQWRSQGPLWRHDEARLVAARQYARLIENQS